MEKHYRDDELMQNIKGIDKTTKSVASNLDANLNEMSQLNLFLEQEDKKEGDGPMKLII